MVGIGVRVPAAPPGRAAARGLSLDKTNPTSTTCSSADSGAVAHLGERLTGSQEVIGSIPIGSTKRCSGPDSGAPAWYAGDGECKPREQLLSRGHLPTVKMAGSHPADAGSTPAVRSGQLCGGSSMVECERAKLATGVRFPFTAPSSPRKNAGMVQRQGHGLPTR